MIDTGAVDEVFIDSRPLQKGLSWFGNRLERFAIYSTCKIKHTVERVLH